MSNKDTIEFFPTGLRVMISEKKDLLISDNGMITGVRRALHIPYSLQEKAESEEYAALDLAKRILPFIRSHMLEVEAVKSGRRERDDVPEESFSHIRR